MIAARQSTSEADGAAISSNYQGLKKTFDIIDASRMKKSDIESE